MRTYVFNAFKKTLQFETDGLKVLSSQVFDDGTGKKPLVGERTGAFDNQGSPKPWTWAWTTDHGTFEIWKPQGICLKLEEQKIVFFNFGWSFFSKRSNEVLRKQISEIKLGKTGPISFGIIAILNDGSQLSLLKDTYPFFDAHMNVTYDGICEDEDFFPLQMMASRLKELLVSR